MFNQIEQGILACLRLDVVPECWEVDFLHKNYNITIINTFLITSKKFKTIKHQYNYPSKSKIYIIYYNITTLPSQRKYKTRDRYSFYFDIIELGHWWPCTNLHLWLGTLDATGNHHRGPCSPEHTKGYSYSQNLTGANNDDSKRPLTTKFDKVWLVYKPIM